MPKRLRIHGVWELSMLGKRARNIGAWKETMLQLSA